MVETTSNLSIIYPVSTLAIGANMLVLSFFFESVIFSALAGISFSLLFLFLMASILNLFNRGEKQFRLNLFDNFSLVIQYLRMNKRYIITSVIGLVISILVITQTMIVVTSYQQYAFDQYVEGSDVSALDISVQHVNNTYFHQWDAFVQESYERWGVLRDLPGFTATTYQTLEPQIILSEQAGFYRYVDTFPITTRNWDREVYALLSNLPSFPGFAFDPDDIIVFAPSSITRAAPEFGFITYDLLESSNQTDDGYSFKLLLGEQILELTSDEYFDNITRSADHIWKWTAQDISYLRENKVVFPIDWMSGTMFMSNEKIEDLRSTLISTAIDWGHRPYIWGRTGFESRFYLELQPLDDYPLIDLLSNLNDLSSIVFDLGFEQISTMEVVDYQDDHSVNERIRFSMTSPLEFVLEEYLENDNNFVSLLQFSITPLIIISLFLFYFSLSIVEDRKIRYFKKLKGRGISNNQVILSVGGEIFSYAILAPLIALPLAFPLAEMLLSQTAVFQVAGNNIPIRVPTDLYWKISLLSVIFSLDFNLPLLMSTFGLSLDMNESDSIGSSLLERGNYDFILLLLAFIYWIFVPYIEVGDQLSDLVYRQLGYVALGMTILASPIFVSRFLIGKLDKLLSVFRNADAVTISIKSIQLNKKFTQKLITLLIISTMFTYIGIVSTATLTHVNDDLTHYQLGSDIYVEGVDPYNEDNWNRLFVEGVESVSFVTRMTFQANGIELREGELRENAVVYEFLGVNASDLENVLYWDDAYANTSLDAILTHLQGSRSIGMQSQVAKGLGLGIGDDFQFLYGFRASRNYTLNLNTTFDFFPRLITSLPSAENVTEGRIKLVQVLTTNEILKELGSAVSRIVYEGALVKLKPGVDRDVIRELYFKDFVHLSYFRVYTDQHDRVSVFNADGSAGSISPLAIYEQQFFQASLTMFLATSLIVTILGMAYYSFVTITQRKREMGIFRALGMVSNQLLRHLIIEILLIVLTSILFSAIVGTYISGYLFRIMSGNVVQTIPPFQIVIPYESVIVYTLVMIGSAIILTLLPSYRLSRSQTGSILR
ncbi:MAG: FtsX-like permease family protein [Candidatus Kariarchaeaceae archaeon]|jgi:ABC-type antimicrobial peptide transport system permease subunit